MSRSRLLGQTTAAGLQPLGLSPCMGRYEQMPCQVVPPLGYESPSFPGRSRLLLSIIFYHLLLHTYMPPYTSYMYRSVELFVCADTYEYSELTGFARQAKMTVCMGALPFLYLSHWFIGGHIIFTGMNEARFLGTEKEWACCSSFTWFCVTTTKRFRGTVLLYCVRLGGTR